VVTASRIPATRGKQRRKPNQTQKAIRELAGRSFWHFLTIKIEDEEDGRLRTLVQITDPPDPLSGDTGGVIDFEMWEHLEEVVSLLGKHKLLNFLKARQVGLSWVIGVYALWLAMYHKAANVLIFSQGEDEAKALLRKIHSVYDNLPWWMREDLGTDNTTVMAFPAMSSRITAFASTENAGRSETASLVIQDEADFHEHIDVNFAALKPTIDANGQVIQISTSNKMKPLSLFKTIFRASPGNGWVSKFYGWNVRPERDQAWYDRVEREAPDTPDMSKALYMEQEYPLTAEEALRPSRVAAAFDAEVLGTMLENSRDPIETRENDHVRIFVRPHSGGRYAAGTDTSHGTGGDYAVTSILDIASGVEVANVRGNDIDSDELARMSVALLDDYRNPRWGIEDNDWGVATIRAATALGYSNFSTIISPGGEDTGKIGWHTDERTRYVLYGDLITAINKSLLLLYDKDAIAEFLSVIRNIDKNGRIEGAAGTHDDHPMATGIAWLLRKDVLHEATVTEIHRFDGE